MLAHPASTKSQGSQLREWLCGIGMLPRSRLLRSITPDLLVALLTLPAGLYLLRGGFWVSRDGLHHLHRVAALTRYLMQGVLYPRWIGEFAFGYGVPAFNFYSPLSYYLTQIFAPLGALWALKLTMLAGWAVSAILLYRFAAQHVGSIPALAAALVYAYAPYRFVDVYPRAAFAEHMAFLWLPLILWAYDGLWTNQRKVWQVLGWAGLVLTHSFTALMFAPFFALYVAWTARWRRQWRPLLWAALSLGLAVGLTAFFWLPLLLEARYANLGAAGISQGYGNHLVRLPDLLGQVMYDYSTGAGRPDYHFAFGIIPAAILLLSLLTLRRSARRFLAVFGIVTCLGSLFLVSRLSGPLWGWSAPVLASLQFPWRFLGVSTFGLALATTALVQALPSTRRRLLVTGAVGLALLISSVLHLPFQVMPMASRDVRPEELWDFDRETGQAGTTWGGEFLPLDVTEQRWMLGRPPEIPQDGPSVSSVTVSAGRRVGDGFILDVDSEESWTFRLHAFYFPGWQVRLDGQEVPTYASTELGLVSAPIPAGQHILQVAFEATTVRHIGLWITVLSLIILPFVVWCPLRDARRRLMAGAWGALVLIIVWGIVPQIPRVVTLTPVLARFGDEAQLVGAEMPAQVRAGQSVAVELYWLALREVSRNDKAFVHLVDSAGQIVAQHDGDPGGGFTPTTRWQQGELMPDRHYLDLPSHLPPGRYQLKAGLYQFDPFRNLLTYPPEPDGRVYLGELTVR